MLGLGAVLNLFKGFAERKKLTDLVKKLAVDLDKDPFEDLNGLERFERMSNLLEAEKDFWIEKLSSMNHKIEILGKVIDIMKTEIAKVENELKKTNANKYDVALLAVNIQELAVNTIQEIQEVRDSLVLIDSQIVTQGNHIEQLNARKSVSTEVVTRFEQKVTSLLQEYTRRYESSLTTVEALQKGLKALENEVSKNNESVISNYHLQKQDITELASRVDKNHSSLQSSVEKITGELASYISETKNILEKADKDMISLKSKIDTISSTVEKNHQKLKDQLIDLEKYTKREIALLDNNMQRVKTILYVVSVILFIAVFILFFMILKK